MKKLITVILAFILVSCYKDKGNYDINMPATPVVTNLDTLYSAVVGDSLIITPTVTIDSKDSLQLEWRIGVPEIKGGYLYFTGPSLRMLFGLEAKLYGARLTVYNKTNGIRYFHDFEIQGGTDFTTGTSVLSLENGVSKLSFINSAGVLKPNIYETINGHPLPGNPMNLYFMKDMLTGGTPLGYWIITKNGGVRLNMGTLQDDPALPNTLADNFFSAPDSIVVGNLKNSPRGTLVGVINDKFYAGFNTTWNQAGTYGMFGDFVQGDYNLATSFIISYINGDFAFIGFNKDKKQFVRFNSIPYYFGLDYAVASTTAFDPTNVGMDLIHMEQVNSGECFAYCKGADGIIYELKFTATFNTNPYTFTPIHKRPFIQQQIINDNTKWMVSASGVFYLGSGEKVYRYNPLNEEVRELETTFGGNTVSMLRLTPSQDTLVAGAGTSLYYMDVSTGKYGVLAKTINDIPGTPIDITWRP